MAVDSRDRRASVLGLGLASLLVLPAPGAIDQPDRQHLAYSYRGIEAASPVPVPEVILVDSVTLTDGRGTGAALVGDTATSVTLTDSRATTITLA